MRQQTVPYRLENNQWNYNHYEDEWVSQENPTPLFQRQIKAWKNHTWKSEHCYLRNHKIIPYVHYMLNGEWTLKKGHIINGDEWIPNYDDVELAKIDADKRISI